MCAATGGNCTSNGNKSGFAHVCDIWQEEGTKHGGSHRCGVCGSSF
jgi:hypothetical protein